MRSNENLKRTLAATGVSDERVLDAVRKIPRIELVPPESRWRAYEDVALFLAEEGRLRRVALVTTAHFVRLVGQHAFSDE